MNAATRLTMTQAILMMATTSSVFGQSPPSGNCANGRCNLDQADYGSAWSAADEQAYDARSRSVRPAARSSADEFPELPASWSE